MGSSLPENHSSLVKIKSNENPTDEKALIYDGIDKWLKSKIVEVTGKETKIDPKDHTPKDKK